MSIDSKNGVKSSKLHACAGAKVKAAEDKLMVNHIQSLSENFGSLLSSQSIQHDVAFIIGSESIHAHKIILASRSEYFRLVTIIYITKFM